MLLFFARDRLLIVVRKHISGHIMRIHSAFRLCVEIWDVNDVTDRSLVCIGVAHYS